MTDSGKKSDTGAAIDYVAMHYLAETAEWRTDRYFRYAELTDLVRGWVDAHPEIATLGTIGQTGEGREIWVVTITNRATGPDTEKPAYYVDANIHAGEVTGSAVALGTIQHLLTRYGTDERVTKLIDETTIYIIPRIMIDASEVYLTTADRMRSSIRTWPDRSAEIIDGIRVSDVDGDGQIAYMRVRDQDGPWKASTKDDRVMIPRGPDETGGEYYFVHPEGTIDNWDGGTITVAAPEWGLDLNRNMPRDWKPEWTQKGAGPYPLSEPETRAVADFILGHPNIHGSQHYHTQSRVILRASALRPDDELPEADLNTYKAIGKMGEEETGYKCVSIYHDFAYDKKKPIYGSFQDWMFDYVGVFSFATELWSLPMEAGCDVTDFIKWPRERTEDDDLKMLHLIDQQADGRGFSPWRAFDHPQLGPVELGGWTSSSASRTPRGRSWRARSTATCRSRSGRWRPRRSSGSSRAAPSGSVMASTGSGRWSGTADSCPPTGRRRPGRPGSPRPVKVTLALPAGATVGSASGQVEQEIGHLAGRSSQHGAFAQRSEYPNLSRKLVEWTVTAPDGTDLPITAATPRAGTVRTTIVLGRVRSVPFGDWFRRAAGPTTWHGTAARVVFADRTDAGRQLAGALTDLVGEPGLIVLGLPRGGVPVAAPVATALGSPLDAVLVRKLGVPRHEELAMGAIASGGALVLNRDVVDQLRIPDDALHAAVERERRVLAERERRYRGDRLVPDLQGRTVVIVDDGLATGATMRAAIETTRTRRPAAVVVAVPTGARETCRQLATIADRVVCLDLPEPFSAVGLSYRDFRPTTDDEVVAVLEAFRTGS